MGIFRLAILKQKVWYIDSWVEIKLTGWFGIIIMSRMGRSVCTSQQRNYSYYSPFPSQFHISICIRSLLKLTWKSIQNAWEWLDVGFPMSFLLGSVPFLCSCWSSSSAKAQKPLEARVKQFLAHLFDRSSVRPKVRGATMSHPGIAKG